ncbi:MAG: hypothetical protein L0216_17780 [Planctomycetales bacterium]|nr:hypothetical protein [Planctomycetales bacterium]
MEAAKVEFPVVVDRENVVAGQFLGQKVIPLYTLVDEMGILRLTRAGGPGKKAFAEIEALLAEPVAQAVPRRTGPGPRPTLHDAEKLAALESEAAENPTAARPRFLAGVALLALGRDAEALVRFRAALALDRADWLCRKQIWALEHPEKFYEGPVDYGWQKEQIRREDEAAEKTGK